MFLRLGLSDLLIGIGIFGAAAAVVAAMTGAVTVEAGTAMAAGAIAYLAVAPLLYRAFGLRPMHFPRCPHCGAPDGPWGVSSGVENGVERMVCFHCRTATAFWYRAPEPTERAPETAAYLLRWPRPLGIWKRLS